MRTAHFLRLPITTSQDLSVAALSYTTTIARRFKLEELTIHFSQNVTETITITRDSGSGANYDTVLVKRSLAAEQDFVFRPQGECNFLATDALKVACTNAGGVGICYCEIKLSEM